mmetsp:Transcript_19825/g.19833  ORF Transcript_19825/g.19833 Transcript_19825/m.19833 type:complete len:367 (-) Transcript_19825:76-1176(-)
MGVCFNKPKGMTFALTSEVKENLHDGAKTTRKPNVRLSVVASSNPQISDEDLPEPARTDVLENIKTPAENHCHKVESRIKIEGAPPNGHQQGFEDKKHTVEGINVISELNSLGIGFACKKGLKPDQFNQDDFSIIIDPDFKFFGVFDGHGTNGHHISKYVHSILPDLITSHESFPTNLQEAINDGFVKAHQALYSQCSKPETDYDCRFSGTTATTAIIKNNQLMIGHVGDSRAILGIKKGSSCEARRITTDHKANLPSEMDRIIASNGEVKKLPDDYPHRIFVKGKEYPGLSTSRTIGDAVAQTIGVIPIPEIHELEIVEDFELLIMCSDGVWEFMSDQEAIDIVKKYEKNIQQAANKLASFAWTK